MKSILQKFGTEPKEIKKLNLPNSKSKLRNSGTLIDIDDKDLEFERVTNSIDVVDREYGIEVIFDYYRRHGFPHYTIREEEINDHLKKLRKFDVDTIFKDNQIVQTNQRT